MKLDHRDPHQRMRMFFGLAAASWGGAMWMSWLLGQTFTAIFWGVLATIALHFAVKP